MNTTLVINGKGGVGKTTLTVNLASYFAQRGVAAAIIDYDVQQESSLSWLSRRPCEASAIVGAAAIRRSGLVPSGSLKYVPAATHQLVVDAPARASKLLMQDLLDRCDCILVPVGPSAIDIDATARFLRDLLVIGRIRHRELPIALVANRVRSPETIYEPLERFAESLRLPFLTRIHDSQVFVDAAERGLGIFEMEDSATASARAEFQPIVRWVEGVTASSEASGQNVACLGRPCFEGGSSDSG